MEGWGAGALGHLLGKVLKVKQATSCEQLANYALQLLSVADAAAAVDAAPLPQAEPLNDLQVK